MASGTPTTSLRNNDSVWNIAFIPSSPWILTRSKLWCILWAISYLQWSNYRTKGSYSCWKSLTNPAETLPLPNHFLIALAWIHHLQVYMHACMSALVKLIVCSCITDDCIVDLYQYCNNGGLYVIDVTIIMIWKERERERERERHWLNRMIKLWHIKLNTFMNLCTYHNIQLSYVHASI